MTTNTPPTPKDVRIARATLDEAKRRFDTDHARLYRPDGKKLYADDLHAQKVNELRAGLRPAITAALETADAAHHESIRRLTTTLDPRWNLPAAELARYRELRLLAQDDFKRLNAAQIAGRLTAAARSNDPALILAYGDFAIDAIDNYGGAPEWAHQVRPALAELDSAAATLAPAPNSSDIQELEAISADLHSRAASISAEIDPPRVPNVVQF